MSLNDASSAREPAHPKPALSRNVPRAIGLGCLAVVVTACLFIGSVFVIAHVALRSSDAYQIALATAQRDSSVGGALGTPIRPGWLTTGQVHANGTSGEADLKIPITGPRGSATIEARAEKSAGKWTFSVLRVRFEGRATPLDLVAAGNP